MSFGICLMPEEPCVSGTASLTMVWMISPNAIVQTARYGPRRRSAGTPRITPKTAAKAVPASMQKREVDLELPHQDGRGVRAHREEAGVARRDVAGVAHHQVEPRHHDDVDADLREHRVHDVLVADEIRDERQRDDDSVKTEAFQDVHGWKGKLETRNSKLEESGIKIKAGSRKYRVRKLAWSGKGMIWDFEFWFLAACFFEFRV